MSKYFFQEGIEGAIGLLNESLAAKDKRSQLEKRQAAFDIMEKFTGLLAGLKGKEEREFASLMQYTTELLNDLRAYDLFKRGVFHHSIEWWFVGKPHIY